jgi:hypothetical protein
MTHYSKELIEQIKEIDLYSLVQYYGVFKRKGIRSISNCPFHNERTPSFEVNHSRNTYHCYGCGVHGKGVINFVMAYEKLSFYDAIKWILSHYNIHHDNESDFLKSDLYKTKYIAPQPKQIDYISKAIYQKSLNKYENNNFIIYLKSIINNEKVVNELVRLFQIGTGKNDFTAFPMIDIQDNIRTGQIVLFDKVTGRRNKDVQINWLHNMESMRISTYEMCLFGSHQLNRAENENKSVAIVEAPKTAITMTYLEPKYIWLASCGVGGLSVAKCEPLQKRDIILYPDVAKTKDQVTPLHAWTKVKTDLDKTKLYGQITVSDTTEKFVNSLDPESEQCKRIRTIGYDLHDFAVDNNWFKAKAVQTKPVQTIVEKTLSDMILQNPNVQAMIERFEMLNPVTRKPYLLAS